MSVKTLLQYVRHKFDCYSLLGIGQCNCGLDAAIKAAQTDKQPGQPNGHVVCPTPTCRMPNDCLMRGSCQRKAAQPDGWVSVPREPTPEMWDAAWNSIGLPYRAKLSMHEIKTLFDKFHSAMLAAAPKETK